MLTGHESGLRFEHLVVVLHDLAELELHVVFAVVRVSAVADLVAGLLHALLVVVVL